MFGLGKKKKEEVTAAAKKGAPLGGRVTGAGLAPNPGPRPFWIRGTTPDGQALMLRANRTEVDTLIADLQKLVGEQGGSIGSLDEPQ
jgi:hypothetical protein